MPTRLDVLLRTPSIALDATGFPVVYLSISDTPSRDEFASLLGACSALLDRQKRFSVVIDARTATPLSFEQTMDASGWLVREDGRLRRLCRGAALAVSPDASAVAVPMFLRVCPLRARAAFDDVSIALRWAVRALGPPVQSEAPEFS